AAPPGGGLGTRAGRARRRLPGPQSGLPAWRFPPPLGGEGGVGAAPESPRTHVSLTEPLAPGIRHLARSWADWRIREGAGAGYAPRYVATAVLMNPGGLHAAR